MDAAITTTAKVTETLDGAPAVSENDRLIKTLETCFSNLLAYQQEQAKKQDEQSDRLHRAVETLKQKAPITDKKTAFWNAYKTLADEHDEEFQRKYSTDLDTALIFAGLFSAVTSAFIIQIQPGIQPHTADLLVLIAQNLLYVSLFSTLLAALLAVLGKQWLMHYLAAGERGTLETRGLERQRKFDGLRRWKFEAVMHIFPLLLQIGLFLFSAALSIYLRTIHTSLAIVALSFTSIGFISYTALLISAVAAPDSPFQTPLATLSARLIPTTLWKKLETFSSRVLTHPLRLIHQLSTTCSPCLPQSRNLLPLFRKGQFSKSNRSKADTPHSIFGGSFPEPSAEVPAVSWVLETSTDPHMIDLAAEMAVHLQWPSTMDVRPQLSRLSDAFLACFDHNDHPEIEHYVLNRLLDGMALQAVHRGRAFCVLQCIPQAEDWSSPEFSDRIPDSSTRGLELLAVFSNLGRGRYPIVLPDTQMKWALQVIPVFHSLSPFSWLAREHGALKDFMMLLDRAQPSLDAPCFADYLFCIISLLSPVHRHDMACMDKSPFVAELFERLFEVLLQHLTNNTISVDFAAEIVYLTGRLASNRESLSRESRQQHLNQLYNFCGSLPQTDGWVRIVLAAGLLTETYVYKHGADPGWVYRALDTVNVPGKDRDWDNRIATGVTGLFNALIYYNAAPMKEHIRLILHALSFPGNISRVAGLLLLQDNVKNWFQDEVLRPVLQKASVWSHLTRYHGWSIKLGSALAEMPDWKSEIREELCSWIAVFWRMGLHGPRFYLKEEYNSIISRLWNPDLGQYEFIHDSEKALGLTFGALLKVWEDVDFVDLIVSKKVVQMLRGTGLAVLRTSLAWVFQNNESVLLKVTPRFITAFSVPLHASLIRAAAANRFEDFVVAASREPFPEREILENVGRIVEDIANKMPLSSADLEKDSEYWYDLRVQFNGEIEALEKSLYYRSTEAVL